MSPNVWSEVRDAVRPSVAAGQLLPHRAAQISAKYRVDLSDVTRIYVEERNKFLERTGQPADPVSTVVENPEPATEPQPAAEPRPAELADLKCPHCSQLFESQYQLSAHMRVHPEALTVPCDLCEARSISTSALKKHKDNMHKGWRKARKQQPAATADGPGTMLPGAPPAFVDAALNTGQPAPSATGLQAARDTVTLFTSADQPEAVQRAANDAAAAIDRLQEALASVASELAARADELRAELARLEAQLAQVQEPAA